MLNLREATTVKFDWYDNIGGPGIFGEFSFIKSDMDLTLPEWYYVSFGTINRGTDIVIMTTEAAKVYLVPAGTAAEISSITESVVAIAEASAYKQVKLVTSSLQSGDYVVYALDSSNNISKASRLITLQIPVNSLIVKNESIITVIYNAAYEFVEVKSTNDLKQINVYNILGEKLSSENFEGKTYKIQTRGLNTGHYFVQVYDSDGNLKTNSKTIR